MTLQSTDTPGEIPPVFRLIGQGVVVAGAGLAATACAVATMENANRAVHDVNHHRPAGEDFGMTGGYLLAAAVAGFVCRRARRIGTPAQ